MKVAFCATPVKVTGMFEGRTALVQVLGCEDKMEVLGLLPAVYYWRYQHRKNNCDLDSAISHAHRYVQEASKQKSTANIASVMLMQNTILGWNAASGIETEESGARLSLGVDIQSIQSVSQQDARALHLVVEAANRSVDEEDWVSTLVPILHTILRHLHWGQAQLPRRIVTFVRTVLVSSLAVLRARDELAAPCLSDVINLLHFRQTFAHVV